MPQKKHESCKTPGNKGNESHKKPSESLKIICILYFSHKIPVYASWMRSFRKSIAFIVMNFNNNARKNMNLLPYSIRMYWTNFWQPTVLLQQNIFEKNHIELGSSHLYASFGIFCVQIGQLVEAQWDFKLSFKNAILPFFYNFQRLTLPRIIDQFERKICQKKRRDVEYKLL